VTAPATPKGSAGSARLFVALPVPATVRRGLERVRERLLERDPDLRFTRPEGWHVTLAFLGSVPAARMDEVGRVVRAAVADASAGAEACAGAEAGAGMEAGAGGGGAGSGTSAGVGPIGLRLAGPGRFGRHVLWVGMDDDPPGAVAALGDRLQAAIAAAELPVQRQDVRPHLTLARGGRGRPVRTRHLDDLAEALDAVVGSGSGDGDDVGWVADEVQVWRSELGRGPARYHLITDVPLRGG
jgi:RNA 2',3'-cyclic 3'-phosphodiesterase